MTIVKHGETYKPIYGYECLYEVSNLGNIKSLSKHKKNKQFSHTTKEKILKNIKCSTGYMKVTLCRDGACKQIHIHRLVAEAFIENTYNKPQVNHIDGDKANNNAHNLEWVTTSENGLHAYSKLGIKNHFAGKKGIDHSTSKPVLQIGKDGSVKKWDCAMDAVREDGFRSCAISRCCRGKISSHKGYIWRYA